MAMSLQDDDPPCSSHAGQIFGIESASPETIPRLARIGWSSSKIAHSPKMSSTSRKLLEAAFNPACVDQVLPETAVISAVGSYEVPVCIDQVLAEPRPAQTSDAEAFTG